MKLLTAEYDYTEETAQVELSHKGKIYRGSAHYKEEDKNVPNRFFGQHLAEKRAMIGYWKEQRDKNKIKKQALKSLRKDIERTLLDKNIPYGEREEIIIKILDNHIKYYDKTTKDYAEAIQIQKDNIQRDIQLREQLLKKVKIK